MLTCNSLNELAPPYLAELLELYEPSHTLRSGNQLNLCMQDMSQVL